jgi:hypothetical protein
MLSCPATGITRISTTAGVPERRTDADDARMSGNPRGFKMKHGTESNYATEEGVAQRMSALEHKRTSPQCKRSCPDYPPLADMKCGRFGPIADIDRIRELRSRAFEFNHQLLWQYLDKDPFTASRNP